MIIIARTARIKSETGIYHLILRGINRRTIFVDDEDKVRFIETLIRYKKISGYNIFAYCLMGNHLHLLVKTSAEPLEQIMRRICGSFVYWYNKKYDRTGNLFQDRYKSEPVENDEYLLNCSRYIHQNPLKAGIQKNLAKYKWSSYRDYLNGTGITDTEFILGIFNTDKKLALDSFIKFTNKTNEDICLEVEDYKRKITDEELIKMIENELKIKPEMIKTKSKEKMKAILQDILNMEDVSARQLARVIGISPNAIWRM